MRILKSRVPSADPDKKDAGLISIEEKIAQQSNQDLYKKLRSIELTKEYQAKLSLKNQLDDDFKKAQDEQQRVYREAKETHESWRKGAEDEVKALEERRRLALLPIEEDIKRVENETRKLEKDRQLLLQDRQALEDEKEVLFVRLDRVADREMRAVETQTRLSLQEQSLLEKKEQLSSLSQEFTASLRTYATEQKRQDAALKEREAKILLREKSLEGAILLLNKREERIKQYEVLFANFVPESPITHGKINTPNRHAPRRR